MQPGMQAGTAPRGGATKGPSQEYLLLDYVQRLGRSREARRVLHIHLSQLRPYNRQDHHIRIAAATFDALAQEYEGQTFVLSNSDIVFCCKGASTSDLEAAIMKVRFLFSEDPLSQGDGEEDLQRFCTWFDLEVNYDDLLNNVKELHRERERKLRQAATQITVDPSLKKNNRRPIDPDQLTKLVAFRARADLSNLMRRQPIVAFPQNQDPQVIFRELFVSISDLQQTVLPEFDLTSSIWLFQHLTQTLDARMLSLLMRNDDSSISQSFSINLNVATVLSQGFLNFDASLKSTARGTVVIELQKVDIFGDMGSYLFARDFMRERGYRICLDGLSHLNLQFIDRERLGLDLLKLQWTPDMADDVGGKRYTEIREQVMRSGRARIILCRCDTDEALRFGQALGISMYQGRWVDKQLQERKIS